MKIILVTVVSLDGKTTKGVDGPSKWSSVEDQAHFQSQKAANNLIVMGRATYEASKEAIQLEEGKLRVVLTHSPQKYQNLVVSGQLEFSNESPEVLVKRLEKLGYKQMLLVGGAEISTLFFQAKLIDEIWLTVEPQIFGSGKNLVDEGNLDIQLALLNVEKLNPNGTLLLKYKVKTAR